MFAFHINFILLFSLLHTNEPMQYSHSNSYDSVLILITMAIFSFLFVSLENHRNGLPIHSSNFVGVPCSPSFALAKL